MGLHPEERVREYRDKGYWTDDMIDALLRERVAQFGDITAITDPLNREALLDGPFRTLTWPQLDEQVSRLAQVLLAEGAGSGDVIGVQLPNTVEIVVAFLAIVRIGAIVAPFPVQYRANTVDAIRAHAKASGLDVYDIRVVPDPTYLALNSFMFRASVMSERLMPKDWGVHLLGDLVRT